jgi:hypothetical protein
MVRAQGLLANLQHPYVKWLDLCVLALVVVYCRDIIEANCYVGVIRTQGLFPNLQRAVVQWLGLRVFALF